METKSLWKSRTVWANLLSGVIVIGSGQFGVTIPHAPEVLAVANILLRLITAQGVSLSGR